MAINYTKIGWDTSKYVNPTNMNQMDNGIKAACDGVDAISANYVKLSGPEQTVAVTYAVNTGFFFQSGTGRSNIGFKNSSGTVLGFLGVGSDSKPYFYDNAYREIALVENTAKQASLGSAPANATTEYNIPTSMAASGGVYLVAINNGYGVGAVALLFSKGATNPTTTEIVTLRNSSFFTINTVSGSYSKFSVTAGGAAGTVYITRIA